jgi:hypothetical protein
VLQNRGADYGASGLTKRRGSHVVVVQGERLDRATPPHQLAGMQPKVAVQVWVIMQMQPRQVLAPDNTVMSRALTTRGILSRKQVDTSNFGRAFSSVKRPAHVFVRPMQWCKRSFAMFVSTESPATCAFKHAVHQPNPGHA